MSISTPAVQPAGATESVAQPTTDDVVVVRRRTIDSILTGAGALLVVVLVGAPYRRGYFVCTSSGTTGYPGLFVHDCSAQTNAWPGSA